MFWTSILISLLITYFIITKLFIIVEFREQVIQERLGKFKRTYPLAFTF